MRIRKIRALNAARIVDNGDAMHFVIREQFIEHDTQKIKLVIVHGYNQGAVFCKQLLCRLKPVLYASSLFFMKVSHEEWLNLLL